MNPSIGAVIIARNERANIRACLACLRDLDEIVVLDTGSTDGTPEAITEPWVGEMPRLTVIREPRSDPFHFGHARNRAASHATSDWLMSVDADERLEHGSGPRIRAGVLAAEFAKLTAATVRFSNRPGAQEYDRLILWRRGRWHWRWGIHELLYPVSGPRVAWKIDNVRMTQIAKDDVKREGRHGQNLELLRLELEREPEHIGALWHLGMELGLSGDKDGCVRELRRWLSKSSSNSFDTSQAHITIGWALKDMGRISQALASFQAAHKIHPRRREPLVGMASCYARMDLYRDAERALAQAVEISPKEKPEYPYVDEAAWGNGPATALLALRDALATGSV